MMSNFQLNAKLSQMQSVYFHGIPVIIEWPKGSVREGKDKNGKSWRREQKADYGYIDDGSTAVGDNEPLDIYIGDDRKQEAVYVLEQLKEDGKTFDEYKLVAGVPDLESAQRLYLSHYPKEWGDSRLGDCFETDISSLQGAVEKHQEDYNPKISKSSSLDEIGKHWDDLGQFNLRLGWLRTQAHICEDWMKFARPWSQLTDVQKTKVAKRAAEVSEPGYNHKMADRIRKSSGGKAGAIEKVVRILGSNGIGSLIVGGVAVQEYGYPRNTEDTDLVVPDVGKAREVLLQNGYDEGNEDWDVFDPEWGEEIELLRGGSKVMFSNIPLPMPQEVNVRPKFCDLPTLLDLKIDAYTNSEAFGKIHGIDVKRIQDEPDVKFLIINNQLPRNLLSGKYSQREYERLWDQMHKSSDSVKNIQGGLNMNKIAGEERMMQLWDSVKGTEEDQAGTALTGFYGDGPATCMDCRHRKPHSKDANGEEVDSCNHKLVKLDPELADRRLPDGTIKVDADDWCRFAQKPVKEEGESSGNPANGQKIQGSRKNPVVGAIYLSSLASME